MKHNAHVYTWWKHRSRDVWNYLAYATRYNSTTPIHKVRMAFDEERKIGTDYKRELDSEIR